ncbi:hypothetical protein SAMN05192535_2904 [Shouchella rhizosphaerae]|nr:hypothetical protein SAMN05192535_2904 [Shouchella rhizosphaerae]
MALLADQSESIGQRRKARGMSLAFFVNFMNKINNMHLMNVILKTVTLS